MPNAKKILIKKLPKFEADVYANLSFGDLVVFALSYLEEKEIEVNTEEIVSICFRLFPQKFGMKQFPRWPDSALVIRRINDEREKKNIKGNPAEGFALTFKGKQVAKRVGNLLGIKKKDASKKKKQKPAALVLTKKTLRRRVRKPIQTKPVKKKVVKRQPKKTNKVVTLKLKKKVVEKKKNVGHAFSVTNTKAKSGGLQTRPTKVSVKKKITKAVATKPTKKITVKQKSKPKQLTMALVTPTPVKKKVEVKKQVETNKEALKPVKVEPVVQISKEEKEKAGKVIKIIERSDAYRSYTKNGKQAKISEFDFRNMLFATMESSSDTLTRNVALFKKYANIHSRNDLMTFLSFCEENFAKLLKKR